MSTALLCNAYEVGLDLESRTERIHRQNSRIQAGAAVLMTINDIWASHNTVSWPEYLTMHKWSILCLGTEVAYSAYRKKLEGTCC